VVVVAAVYANSVRGVFVYDDVPAILENPTLRPPLSLPALLFYPGDEAGTVGGRPLLNLSLGLNAAFGGNSVAGYHLVNIAIHALAALTLFGLVRRLLEQCGRSLPFGPGECLGIAFVLALLWAVHSLQTEAVTYVIQRAESLMGLFYLLTLYAFARAAANDGVAERWWAAACIASCLAGMATKESMVSAPIVVLAYDRMFTAASWTELWRRRGRLHLALAGTWILLAALMGSTRGRGGTVGAAAGADSWSYLLTQCRALGTYLRLALWPDHLVFDYGPHLDRQPAAVLASALVVLAALVLTGWAVGRRHPAGFAGLFFFAVLAPTSSVVPIVTEPIAEHRMYLPLAAVLGLIVAAAFSAVRRWPAGRIGFIILTGAATVALGAATIRRNRDYFSAVALWSDTVAKAPANPRARNNLGQARLAAGDAAGARADFAAAIDADPDYLPAQYNLGASLLDEGHAAEAIPHLEKAQSAPRHRAESQRYLGEAHEALGQFAAAAKHYRAALALEATPEAAFGLGNMLAAQGRYADAIAPLREARDLRPGATDIRNNLGNALLFAGRVDDAIAEYRAALALDPANDALRKNLDLALEARTRGIRP
jgi:tetratricopeptide (TPR) repeat protein